MRFYGIEYCTETQKATLRPVKFDREDNARRWRDEIGPGGTGQAYGQGNSHRRIRTVYLMPHRWRIPRNVTDNALSNLVSVKGEYVE